VEYWAYVGSGNMHSTAENLLVWLNNFYHPQAGWEDAFQIMQTRGILNNGDTLDYAFGVNINKYKKENRISHGGSIGGYRSIVQAFPEHELNIVMLTNFSSSDVGSRLNRLSDILLKLDADVQPAVITADEITSRPLPNEELEKFCGHYCNEKSRYSRSIYLKDDTLRYLRPESVESKLLPIGKNRFQMVNVAYEIMVFFELQSGKQKVMVVQVDDGDPIRSESYDPPEQTSELLSSYTGRYYSQELDTHYNLYVRGDTMLMGNHVRHGDFKISIKREDYLTGASGAFREIMVKRDKRGRIYGLLVSNGRVRNLWFEKL
jgi:hypothetical protein